MSRSHATTRRSGLVEGHSTTPSTGVSPVAAVLRHGENQITEFKAAFGDAVIESLVAFANTQGGSVFVGIADSGAIRGVEVGAESIQNWVNEVKSKTYPNLVPTARTYRVDSRHVVELTVPEHPAKPVAVRGRYYGRFGNANHLLDLQQIAGLYLRSSNASWDSYCVAGATLSAVSLDKVQQFTERANAVREHPIEDDPLTVLRKFDLIHDQSITNGCRLLFSAGALMEATVQVGRFADATTIRDDLTIAGDLFSQVDDIFGAVKKHINKRLIITGAPRREERWQYPLDALREVIVNMVVHRDYQDSGHSIIKVFNDRIEFFNPGRLADGLTVDNLLSGNYLSRIRNKKIAAMFMEAGLVEQYGSGITRVVNSFLRSGLRAPHFENIQHGFRVTVYADSTADMPGVTDSVSDIVVDNVTVNVVEKPTSLADRLVDLIEHDDTISVAQMARALGVTGRTVQRQLAVLRQRGVVQRTGPDKGGRWFAGRITDTAATHVAENVIVNVVEQPTSLADRLVGLIRHDDTISVAQMARALGVTGRTVQRQLAVLRQRGVVQRTGPDKGGRWHLE